MKTQILRLPSVIAANGDSRSALYARIRKGLWTRPIKLGVRASGWPAYEVEALNRARIAGESNEEIRRLVKELEAARRASSQDAL